MPAAKRTYLVRSLQDGKMYSIVAASPRGAMNAFVIKYGSSVARTGDKFEVKERGGDEWETYKVTR